MKNRILLGLCYSIIMLMLVQSVSAELTSWTNIYVDNSTQTVKNYMSVRLRDTSENLIFRSFKSVPVTIRYSTADLPFSLSPYVGQVDWCNLTIKNEITEYSDQKIINTTQEVVTYYFTSGTNNGVINYYLRDLDSITAIMTCHFTDASSLFVESFSASSLSINTPASVCKGCGEYTFEELTKENERLESANVQQLGIFDIMYNVAEINFRIWLYAYWIVKIGLIFLAVYLIVKGIMWFYDYLKALERIF